MPEATLRLGTAPDQLGLAALSGPALVCPASGLRNDPAVAQVLTLLPPGSTTHLPSWRGPFTRLGEWTLDGTLARSALPVAVVNLDAVAQRGPFVLDLAVRYLAPRDRLRLLLARDRAAMAAQVNRAVRFRQVILFRTIGNERIWLRTTDLIAGELAALTLSEDALPPDRSFLTPWEDDLVQRATELDLGARYSGDLHLDLSPAVQWSQVQPAVSALHLRTGIDISSLAHQYECNT